MLASVGLVIWLSGVAMTLAQSKGPNRTDKLNGTFGNISSANWPNDYLPNTQHRWIITTPSNTTAMIHFLSPFKTESAWFSGCYDFVNLIDGQYLSQLPQARCTQYSFPVANRLCGNSVPTDYVSSNNVLIVEFCSDYGIQYAGFGAQWSTTKPPTTTTTGVPVTAFPSSCGLPSAQYPQDISFFPNGSVAYSSYSRIVGGNVAPAHSWPWAVALFRGSGSSWLQFCGGSIIGSQWILTAAHCFFGYTNLNNYCVKIGAANKGSGCSTNENTQQVCKITKVILNSQYNSAKTSSDVALLKLSCVINFTPAIQPVCLPSSTQLVTPFDNMVVVGWGTTSYQGSASQLLQEVIVSVVDQSTCNNDYSGAIDFTMFCAADAGKDSCQGDSGGPIMSHQNGRWIQSGIVSWGNYCADPKFPGVYTDVHVFRSWIDSTISANS